MKILKGVTLILSLLLFSQVLYSQAWDHNKIKWYHEDGGTGDGYAESAKVSYIGKLVYDRYICAGATAHMRIIMNGSNMYTYKWREAVDGAAVISTEGYCLVPECDNAYHGKKFVCEVTDLGTMQIMISDTITLNVIEIPKVTLNYSNDTTLCYGSELSLENTSAAVGEVYTWQGENFVGATNIEYTTVRPEKSGHYTLIANNNGCVDSVSINIQVVKPIVKIPDLLYLREGEDLVLSSEKIEGSRLDWWAGGSAYANKDTLTLSGVAQNMQVVVKAVSTVIEGCSVADSCWVYADEAFNRYKGGEEDGFTHSKQKMSIAGINYTEEVCKGESAHFMLNIQITSSYSYIWKKVGDDSPLANGDNKLFIIENCSETDAGQYYCECTDLDTKETVVTDPVTLTVRDIPKVFIDFPANDTTLCLGEKIELKATADLDSKSGTIMWGGVNIETDPTLESIVVSPTADSTLYQVFASNGICRSYAERKVYVKKNEIKIPSMLEYYKGDPALTITVDQEPNTKFAWKTENDGLTDLHTPFVFTPTQSTLVTVTKWWNNRCPVYDTCQVYVKDFKVDGDYVDDGFTEQYLDFTLDPIEYQPEVCVDQEAKFLIKVTGYGIYRYQWVRIHGGLTTNLDTLNKLVIPSAQISADEGKYFCEVTEVESGNKKYSDTVDFKVLEIPEAVIDFPENGVEICYGMTIDLGVVPVAGATYLWNGLGVQGANNKVVVTVKPEETTTYSVVVNNGVCFAQDYVGIVVKKPEITLPQVIETVSDEMVTIDPKIPSGAIVEWKYSNGNIENAHIFSKNLKESTKIYVTMEYDDCVVKDSVQVFVKQVLGYVGGPDDGFYESDKSFKILGVDYTPIICENATVDFTIRVDGSGLFTYNWKQVGKDDVLSSEQILSLTDHNMSLSDVEIYCEVTDLQRGETLISEPKKLTVKRGPKTIINSPERGKLFCIGETITLDARKTEESKLDAADVFDYQWEGENIEHTNRDYVVNVTPTESQVYTLRVDYFGCVDIDTITINIAKPKIDVPTKLYIRSGDNATIKGVVSNVSVGATISWMNAGLYTPNVNPFVLSDVQKTTVVTAIVEEVNGCKAVDSTYIYVRANNTYRGGEDDGFMESCDVPVINVAADQLLGCGGNDSVALVVDYTGDVESFTWQKYNEMTGEYDEVAEADNRTGLNTATFIMKPINSVDLGIYRCVLSNSCGYVSTKSYVVSNGHRPELDTTIPDRKETYCEGTENIALTIPIKGDSESSEITYRWYKKNSLTGAVQQLLPEVKYNSKVLKFIEVRKSDEGLYVAEAENSCGITRDSVRLNVIENIEITTQPLDTTVCFDMDVRLWCLTYGGTTQSYELQQVEADHTAEGGYKVLKSYDSQASNNYNFEKITHDQAGDYRWKITSDCGGAVFSKVFHITVENPPVFTYVHEDTLICSNTAVTIDALAESAGSDGSNIHYRWSKDNVNLSYITNAITFTVNELAVGNYLCYAKNSCPEVTAPRPVQIGLRTVPVVVENPVLKEASYCEDKAVTISAKVENLVEVDSVRWYRGNVPVYNIEDRIAGADTYAMTIDSLILTDAGNYNLWIFHTCGITQTRSVSLVVDEKARIIRKISEDPFFKPTACEGEVRTLSVVASGKAPLSFMWLQNDTKIAGADLTNYEATFGSTTEYCCNVVNGCGGAFDCVTIEVMKADTFRVEGSGNYCAGEAGREISLNGSDTNYIYRLYEEGKPSPLLVRTGKEAENLGGKLNFGYYKEGKYYVTGEDKRSSCNFKMPGEAVILEDSLPPIFDVIVVRPMCEGMIESADIAVDSSVNSHAVEYTLYKKYGEEWKIDKGLQKGTGDTLIWTDVDAGVYKVMCKDYTTGCVSEMNGQPEIDMRPMPDAAKLIIVDKDSTYCKNLKSDVKLVIDKTNLQATTDYIIKKNGADITVADGIDATIPGEWVNVPYGIYTIESKNEWGCKSYSNQVTVRMDSLPKAYRFFGSTQFCEVDATKTTVIQLEKADPNIKYELFATPKVKLDEQIGEGAAISWDMPLVDSTYYIIATDPKTTCKSEMDNRVVLSSSELELYHDPVYVDFGNNEIMTQFNLQISGNIGTPVIEWSSANEYLDPKDVVDPTVMFFDIPPISLYHVKVSDDKCTKELDVEIVFTGMPLEIMIKNGDQTLIPNDTIAVCKNSQFQLYGSVQGGNGVYQTRWEYQGKKIGNAKPLEYKADKSGYVYFYVESVGNDGTIARLKDSVWLNVHPLPGNDLQIVNNGTNCLAPGQDIELQLANVKTDNSYSLQFSKSGMANTYKATGIVADGDVSGELILSMPYKEDKNGFYGVKVSKGYGDLVCTAIYTGIEVRRGTIDANIGGGGVACGVTGIVDTIWVDTTEAAATYRLMVKRPGDSYFTSVKTQQGVDDTLKFIGEFGNGTYLVLAERENSCVDTINGTVEILHRKKPHVGEMINAGDYCKKVGESVDVIIGIDDCVSGITYRLFREEPYHVFNQVGADYTGVGDHTFGTYNEVGRYVVIADDGYCQDTSWQVRIAAPPVAVELAAIDTAYCELDDKWEIQAKAFKANHLIDYKIYNTITGDSVGIFQRFSKDTVYFAGQLEAGQYFVKGEIGNCSLNMPESITVKQFPLPAKKTLFTPYVSCDNTLLSVGVNSSQNQISYQVYQKGEEEDVEIGSAIMGDGSDLALGTVQDQGVYYIQATNPITGCFRVMDSVYTINQAPKEFNIIAEDTVFCQSTDPKIPNGTRLGLTGVEGGITYYLQKYDDEAAKYVDVQDSIVARISSTNKWWFISPSYRPGKYRVRTNKCNGSLMAGEVEVIEIGVPADLQLSLVGNGCIGENVQIVLNPTENNAKYALFKNGESVSDEYMDLEGNGSALSWTFVSAEKGNYTVEIDKAGCKTLMDTVIRIDEEPLIGTLQGINTICQYADTALFISDWEQVANYRLFNSSDEFVVNGVEDKGKQAFRPVPVGTYYAIANRGNCEKKSAPFTINGIAAPNIFAMDVNISECAEIGKGTIEIKNMADTLDYVLKYPGTTNLTYLSGSYKLLENLALGDYHFRVMDKKTGCYSQVDTLKLRQSVPDDHLLGNLAYCDKAESMRLTLSAVTKDIRYSIYKIVDGERELKSEIFGGTNRVFAGNFTEGEYVFVKKREGLYMPGCEVEETFEIHHYNSPSVNQKLEVLGGPGLCAGGSYEIVVKGAEDNVQYVLIHDAVRMDTTWGPGDVKFNAITESGTYRVLPMTGGACGDTYLDSIIFVTGGPKKVEVQACTYCYEPGVDEPGCEIKLLGTYTNIRYILTNEDGTVDLDSVNGITYETVNFDIFKEGKYKVKAEDLITQCKGEMADIEISKGIAPKKFDVGVDGARCGENLEIATSNGSEGDSVQYYMYKDNVAVSEAVTRNDGLNISFGVQHDPGVYKIYAFKPLYGCGVFMNDSLVILNEINKDTLQLRGVYCTNTSDQIKLRMANSVPNWGYYLVKEVDGLTISSDTLAGTGNSLIWSRIWKDNKKQPLDSGIYKLYALNACSSPLMIDTIYVEGNKPPTPYDIIGGDKKLCEGQTREIVLENSESGVKYDLTLVGQSLTVSKDGNDGDPLSFGADFSQEGEYIIMGTNTVTGCKDTVSRMKIISVPAPPNPVVDGHDVCLGTDAVKELKISLKERDWADGISYYLRYIHQVAGVADTVGVDTMLFGMDIRQSFKSQKEVGTYEVVADNGACQKVWGSYRIGDMPADKSVVSANKSICAGNPFSIMLSGSETGVVYELYRTTAKVDPDTAYVGISKPGDGGSMVIGAVTDSGTYIVCAVNGCRAYMSGQVHLKVTTPYALDLGPGYTICQGDSTKISIFGRTNPMKNAMYMLIAPGETKAYTEMIKGTVDQSSLNSKNYYKTPGFYTVKNAAVYDGVSCMEIDSVELKVRELPQVFTISNSDGGYICSGGTKVITLSGNETGVQYTLKRENDGVIVAVDSKDGGKGKISYEVNLPGNYFVDAKYVGVEPGCEQRMDGIVTLLEVGSIRQIELKQIVGSYCFNTAAAGKIQLVSSESNVEYQLYKDGEPYGTPKEATVAGDPVEWTALPGGLPADPRYPDRKIGFEYTVKAHNKATNCEEDMIGKVVIVEERNVEFDASHFQNAITPCVGDPVQLNVQAWGGNITYEWKQLQTGATETISRQKGIDSYLNIGAVSNSDYGFYKCVMNNKCSKDSTQLIEIKPKMLVEKESSMQDVSVCDLANGESVVKTLKAAMRNANQYTWFKDGVEIAGANSAYYDVTVTKQQGAGEYICKAANDCGSLTDTALITVDSVPYITVTLVEDTLCVNSENYVMNVASDFPIQWFCGDKELTGENATSLTLATVTKDNEGSYFVVSNNSCGNAKVQVATLLVDDTIKVLGNSIDDQSICGGELLNMSISTVPDSTQRVQYRWEDANGKVLGTRCALDDFDLTDYIGKKTYFRVKYSNKCSIGYKDFKLNVVHPIEIDRKLTPDQILLCASPGGTVDTALWLTHPVGMEASYEWYFMQQKDVAPVLIGKTDTIRFDILTKNTGAYYCKVSNICGDSTSQQIWVRVDTVPEIVSTLNDTTICANSPLTLKLAAIGGGLEYNWKVQKNVAGAPEEPFKGEADSIVFRNLNAAYDGAKIWCEVGNACHAVMSNKMTLTVLPMLQMSVTPATAQICEGDSALIEVELVNGVKPWAYSYKYDGEEKNRTSIVKDIDTLRLGKAGVCDFIYMRDDRGCVNMGELGSTTINVNKISTATMTLVGKDLVCSNDSVDFKIHIDGTTMGPWKVSVNRKSDGNVATESGFSEAITINKRDTVITVRPQHTEIYYAVVEDVYSDILCQSKVTTLPIKIEVREPAKIEALIPDVDKRIFGRCDKVDLNTIFNAQPENGEYLADDKPVPGGWLEPGNESNCMISYRIWEDGCETRKNLVALSFTDKPEATIQTDQTDLCPGMGAVVVLKGKGVYPLKMTYSISYLKANGTKDSKSYTHVLNSASDSLKLVENASLRDTYKGVIYTITRLEDPGVCIASLDNSHADTIMYRDIPVATIYARNGKVNGGTWDDINWRFIISSDDSVEFKAVLNKGGMPWNVEANAKFEPSNTLQLMNIPTNTGLFTLKKDDYFTMVVTDKYGCRADDKGYDIKVADTAYLNLKAILEGPYNQATYKMESNVLNLISKKELTAWPNVGSRKIIDWIQVELWQAKASFVGKDSLEMWKKVDAILLDDGAIVDVQGRSVVPIPSGAIKNRKFHVVLRHRNHLAVMSNLVSLENATLTTPVTLDFTKTATICVPSGVQITKLMSYVNLSSTYKGFALSAGDYNLNGLVTVYENNKTAFVLEPNIDSRTTTASSIDLDVNFDGKVEWPKMGGAKDKRDDWAIVFGNIEKYSIVPDSK